MDQVKSPVEPHHRVVQVRLPPAHMNSLCPTAEPTQTSVQYLPGYFVTFILPCALVIWGSFQLVSQVIGQCLCS